MTKLEKILTINLIQAEKHLNHLVIGNLYLERGEITKAICLGLGLDYYNIKTVDYDAAVAKFLADSFEISPSFKKKVDKVLSEES